MPVHLHSLSPLPVVAKALQPYIDFNTFYYVLVQYRNLFNNTLVIGAEGTKTPAGVRGWGDPAGASAPRRLPGTPAESEVPGVPITRHVPKSLTDF